MEKVLIDKESAKSDKSTMLVLVTIIGIIIELIFIMPSFDIMLGPVLFCLLCYLYFKRNMQIMTAIIIIFGNDALGTLVFGKVSMVYLIFVLLMYELIAIKSIRRDMLGIALASVVASLMPAITGVTSLKYSMLTLAYIGVLILLYQKHGKRKFLADISYSVVFIVVLQSIHLLVTGGLIVVEGIERAGLIGIGIGDANYSALALCIAVASCINCKAIPLTPKIAALIILLSAIIATRSISGLLALLLVVVLSLSLNRKISKTLFKGITAILVLVFLYQVYISLPQSFHIESVDSYIERANEKFLFAQEGEYDMATTARSALAEYKWIYITQRLPVINQLIGFNKLTIGNGAVSHNTYVDAVIQFGFVGAAIALVFVIFKLMASIKSLRKGELDQVYILTLKAALLFFAFTLSLYHGPMFALLFVVCILL